jgi:uncharacterized protein (DUF983 family)
MAKHNITLFEALKRGVKCCCPKCGQGKLFITFLKVRDKCQVCSLELHHHKADDMPPYVLITIVGHIVIPLFIWTMLRYILPDWVHFLIWIPTIIVLSIALIQPVKGAIIAFQWYYKMHGFESSR